MVTALVAGSPTTPYVLNRGALEPLLPQAEPRSLGIHALYTSREYQPALLREFLEDKRSHEDGDRDPNTVDALTGKTDAEAGKINAGKSHDRSGLGGCHDQHESGDIIAEADRGRAVVMVVMTVAAAIAVVVDVTDCTTGGGEGEGEDRALLTARRRPPPHPPQGCQGGARRGCLTGSGHQGTGHAVLLNAKARHAQD